MRTMGAWPHNAACWWLCSVAELQNDEVCQMETFHAECPADHVIVMESAQLGRLKIGIHRLFTARSYA